VPWGSPQNDCVGLLDKVRWRSGQSMPHGRKQNSKAADRSVRPTRTESRPHWGCICGIPLLAKAARNGASGVSIDSGNLPTRH
jgi:hypothetical protein